MRVEEEEEADMVAGAEVMYPAALHPFALVVGVLNDGLATVTPLSYKQVTSLFFLLPYPLLFFSYLKHDVGHGKEVVGGIVGAVRHVVHLQSPLRGVLHNSSIEC